VIRWYVILLTAVLVVACAENAPAPIEDRSGGRYAPKKGSVEDVSQRGTKAPVVGQAYTVRKGDTLTSIAFALGIHFKTLAEINNISDPYSIDVGQVLQTRALKKSTSSRKKAPLASVGSKPKSTTISTTIKVSKGDTLYSISRERGVSVDQLAKLNGLKPPYKIELGQQLRVTATATPSAASPGSASKPSVAQAQPAKTASKKTSTITVAPSSSQNSAVSFGPVARWIWPATGKVVRSYSDNLHKGIDIAGQRGADVKASAKGVVVYSGTGVKGYGALIIVKHNEDYLSAYGHNDAILVSEGATVTEGQTIARMGSSGTDTVKLHFEIRRRGKPIDPLKVFPRR